MAAIRKSAKALDKERQKDARRAKIKLAKKNYYNLEPCHNPSCTVDQQTLSSYIAQNEEQANIIKEQAEEIKKAQLEVAELKAKLGGFQQIGNSFIDKEYISKRRSSQGVTYQINLTTYKYCCFKRNQVIRSQFPCSHCPSILVIKKGNYSISL